MQEEDKITMGLAIAGPCSVETREQVLATAEKLKNNNLSYFRAGVWKPRTKPHQFEGVGTAGLPWLAEVQNMLGIPVMVEVAKPDHVLKCLLYGIKVFWIGARTVGDPFAMQALADTFKSVGDPEIFVKNPTSPDVSLWAGAILRLRAAGVTNIKAIHRGFTTYGSSSDYRNEPIWDLVDEFRDLFPEIPMVIDPSHIAGAREPIFSLLLTAAARGYAGSMVEVHIDPNEAKTDAFQQLSPIAYSLVMDKLDRAAVEGYKALANLRGQIDLVDNTIIDMVKQRIKLSEMVADTKRASGFCVEDPERKKQVEAKFINSMQGDHAQAMMQGLYEFLHEFSVVTQKNRG